MRVLLIRHLPTPGNEKRQYIGRTDEALSLAAVEKFQRQHGAGGKGTAYPPVDWIIASPLKRCVQTAKLIWPGQEIRTEPMLRECDFGQYERKTYEELKNEPEYIEWMESGGMTAFPGGEEQTEFRARCAAGAEKWIGQLLEKRADSVAFVIHGGTIMAVLEQLAEGPREFYRWQAENGGGYIAEADRGDWMSGRYVLRNIHRLIP